MEGERSSTSKKVVVVVMGATGSGKSRLAIDLASHFPVEIVNADSMQVYRGLDVLTNKVPLHERRGVPHHLLGTIDPNAEFTSKDFRDIAVPIIDDILSRDCLPVIVGGTNYYIQALVSPFLCDDLIEELDGCYLSAREGEKPCLKSNSDESSSDSGSNFGRLKELDPVAANRIHPNNHRKVNLYLRLYESSGVLPSELLQGKVSEKWGRADSLRYECCFLWVDASLHVLDRYVEQRVEFMMKAGLLSEVHDIYNPNSDYTRGLRQAIGVREFEEFFRSYNFDAIASDFCFENNNDPNTKAGILKSTNNANKVPTPNLREILGLDDNKHKILLIEAIDKLKANTRRLVRRQKRRLNKLKTFFGWHLHLIDGTEAFLGNSADSWQTQVVEPCVSVVKDFLCKEGSSLSDLGASGTTNLSLASRDLWTQYMCEACGNRILRGAHEWEQHRQGRVHRKRIGSLRRKEKHRPSCSSTPPGTQQNPTY